MNDRRNGLLGYQNRLGPRACAAVRAASVTSIPLREPITRIAPTTIPQRIGPHWVPTGWSIPANITSKPPTSGRHGVMNTSLSPCYCRRVTERRNRGCRDEQLLDEHGNRTATTFARSRTVSLISMTAVQ